MGTACAEKEELGCLSSVFFAQSVLPSDIIKGSGYTWTIGVAILQPAHLEITAYGWHFELKVCLLSSLFIVGRVRR